MKSQVEYRAAYYGQCGSMLAQLASVLGQPIPTATSEQWSNTMSRLSLADDASELSPEHFTTFSALDILGLDQSNPALVKTVEQLLTANRDSHEAHSISAHFQARGREAARTSDLLRYQSPEHILTNNGLWEQISRVAIAGVYLDSLLDAQEDSDRLEQFSASQLAIGATLHLAKITPRIHIRTWRSLFEISRINNGLSGAIKGKIRSLIAAT